MKNTKGMKKLMLVAVLLLILGSCYNDKYDKLYPRPATTCDTTTIKYSADIAPIITANCAISGCHNTAGNAVTGGLDYTIFTVLQGNALNGSVVSDINGLPTRGHNAMPLNLPKLPACDINKITRWVNEGAPNN